MPGLTPRDLERIQAVTANYFFWQGLRWVPMGAALLAVGLYWSGWWRVPAPLGDAVQLGVLGLALAISAALGGYYRRRFGAVHGIAGMHARRERIKWVFVYPAMALSLVADMVFAPPVLLSGFVWAGGILAYRRSTGGGRVHYLVAAPLLAAFGLLPLLGLMQPGKAAVNLFVAAVGIVFIIGGLLDHFELGRILRPVPATSDEAPV